MVFHGRHDGVTKSNLLEYGSANECMGLDLFHFSRRKAPGLAENVIRHGQLSDIVKQCAGAKCVDLVLAEAEYIPDTHGIDLGPSYVSGSHLVTGVDGGRERFDRCE